MAECNLTYPTMNEENYAKFSYPLWCPTCERESPPRRRTKSETVEPSGRRKGKEMKTFTPKKYNRHVEYENMDGEKMRYDCCRTTATARSNLCELPTTYISNNCQIQIGDMSNYGGNDRNSTTRHQTVNFYCGTMENRKPSFESRKSNVKVEEKVTKASVYLNSKPISNLFNRSSPERDVRPEKIQQLRHAYNFNAADKVAERETSTFFDRKDVDVRCIRERYHREFEALQAKLVEIQRTRMLAAHAKGKTENHNREIIEIEPETAVQKVEIVDPVKYAVNGVNGAVAPLVTSSKANCSAVGTVPKRKVVKKIKLEKLKTDKIRIRPRSKLSVAKLTLTKSREVVIDEVTDSDFSECEAEAEPILKDANSEESMKLETPEKLQPENISDGNLAKTDSQQLSEISDKSDGADGDAAWPLRESLFPNIPPYVNFNTYDAAVPFSLPNGRRYLKWKLSTITPVLVRKTLTNTGFSLIRKSNDWLGCWGKHMKSPQFRTLKQTQKLNHFPGTFQVGRKDRLWKNLQRLMYKFGVREFGFIPQSFVLPQDIKLLKAVWAKKDGSDNEIFIIKPPASARGVGIKVINKWSQLPKKQALVVQRYISNPYLINGSKFDLRLYVLVTSFNPLRIYLYPEGLARFASAKYSDSIKNLKDRYMHLTNYSINKLSSQYTANEDAFACQGHKWTLSKLWEYLRGKGVDTGALWRNMEDLVIKTMICGESSITQLYNDNVNSRFNCYELFGVDILLDEQLKCWLLEVNISPSLHSASPLDAHVKGPMVKAVFDMAQFHLPARIARLRRPDGDAAAACYDPRIYTTALTRKEKQKHARYVQLEWREEYLGDILANLTGDDVRHLTQAEDEMMASGSFQRIFPTAKTYRYLKFMEVRYYNRLFDAWETKYEKNRGDGIEVLRKKCEEKVHLKVGSKTNLQKESLNTIPALEELCQSKLPNPPNHESDNNRT